MELDGVGQTAENSYSERPLTPETRPSGLPNRKTQRPRRYEDFTDELPPPPPPIFPELDSPPDSMLEDDPSPPSVLYTTPPNQFHVFHVFNHGPPSYSPNEVHSTEALSDSPNLMEMESGAVRNWWTGFGSSVDQLKKDWFAPFLSASSFRLMKWFYGASTTKSLTELDLLVQEVLLAEDFKTEELRTFRMTRENQRLDDWENSSQHTPFSLNDGWQSTSVEIPLGAEQFSYRNTSLIPKYSVPGLFYRRPLDVIKAALTEPAAQQFHLTPFSTYWKPSPESPPERIYSEIISSDAYIEEYEKIYSSPREGGCKLETVVISLMFWSDSTHLTSFGDASLWPIYMFFGNLSKYTRGKPSTFSAHHLAYIPKVCIPLVQYNILYS